MEVVDCGELAPSEMAAEAAGLDAGGGAGGALDMGGEALLRAAADGDARTARALLEAGVSADAYGSHRAAGEGSEAVEQTALHVAAQHAQVAVVGGLLRRSARMAPGLDPRAPPP